MGKRISNLFFPILAIDILNFDVAHVGRIQTMNIDIITILTRESFKLQGLSEEYKRERPRSSCKSSAWLSLIHFDNKRAHFPHSQV